MDSSNPPVAVHCLYSDRHRQLRCHDAGATSGVGDLLAAAATRLAPVFRSVLVRAAVRHQVARRGTHRYASLTIGVSPVPKRTSKKSAKLSTPALLAGGNPQIAKADGDAPVQAYIAAMPGWKRDVGRRLDSLIERTIPGVRKAVKWNSPFYGIE